MTARTAAIVTRRWPKTQRRVNTAATSAIPAGHFGCSMSRCASRGPGSADARHRSRSMPRFELVPNSKLTHSPLRGFPPFEATPLE